MEVRQVKSLVNLPAELYDEILYHVDPSETTKTAVALAATSKRIQFSRLHFYRHLFLTTQQQTKLLLLHLSRDDQPRELQASVRSFSLRCWAPDDALIDILLRRLPLLQHLDMWIGPRWDPLNLSTILDRPLTDLRSINLRFNLSQRSRNYLQFHKGQYFDNMLHNLAKWPAQPMFSSFSLVQDVPPTYPVPNDDLHFAQPIVLFGTFALSSFAASPLAANVRHLRVRLPNKYIIAALASPATSTTVSPSNLTCAILPSLEVLDISTTYAQTSSSIKVLLVKHRQLRHLIMDRSALMPPHAEDDLDTAKQSLHLIGKTIASISLFQAAEVVSAWRQMRQRQTDLQALLAKQPPQNCNEYHKRLSQYDSLPQKLLVCPHPSNLVSLSAGEVDLPAEAAKSWNQAFQAGHAAGRARCVEVAQDQLGQIRRAAKKGDGITLLRFASSSNKTSQSKIDDPWLTLCTTLGLEECSIADLANTVLAIQESRCTYCCIPDCSSTGGVAWSDVPASQTSALMLHELDERWRRPLCEHPIGCGHRIARSIWEHRA